MPKKVPRQTQNIVYFLNVNKYFDRLGLVWSYYERKDQVSD